MANKGKADIDFKANTFAFNGLGKLDEVDTIVYGQVKAFPVNTTGWGTIQIDNDTARVKYFHWQANGDIFFDDSLKLLDLIDFNKKVCVAITRHESNNTKKIIRFREEKYIGCSQDCWIFKGHISIDNIDLVDFNFGIPGCDNRLAYELDRNGYKILNPCKDIIIYHYHTVRGPSLESKRIPQPYKMLTLTRLGELQNECSDNKIMDRQK